MFSRPLEAFTWEDSMSGHIPAHISRLLDRLDKASLHEAMILSDEIYDLTSNTALSADTLKAIGARVNDRLEKLGLD